MHWEIAPFSGYDGRALLAANEDNLSSSANHAVFAAFAKFLAAESGAFVPGEIMPNGQIAGMGPGAMLNNEFQRAVAAVAKPGRFDFTATSLREARAIIQRAMPNAVELPEAVAGQPYPSPPAGEKTGSKCTQASQQSETIYHTSSMRTGGREKRELVEAGGIFSSRQKNNLYEHHFGSLLLLAY